MKTTHYSIALAAISALMLTGCHSAQPHVLGATPPGADIVTVHAASSLSPGKTVTVRGEMTEKCPVAGCWFMLKDGSGIVRVDTKAAGFVVTDVPLHTTVTVAGTVSPGDQPGVSATGVSY